MSRTKSDTLALYIILIFFTETVIFQLAGCSWVHRDLSASNIYLYKDKEGKPHLKLGDVEYAKNFTTLRERAEGVRDARTVRYFYVRYLYIG